MACHSEFPFFSRVSAVTARVSIMDELTSAVALPLSPHTWPAQARTLSATSPRIRPVRGAGTRPRAGRPSTGQGPDRTTAVRGEPGDDARISGAGAAEVTTR